MIKEKPVLKRMTLFVIGESISLKKIFIKSLLKDHQSQNESLLAFYYGVISDSQKTEFPFRIFDIDLFEYSNFFEQFPMFESFDEAEMGFIYTYNTEDDDKSINILADFLQKLNVLFSSQQKVEKMTKEEQNFRNNYGKKIDFFIVGISKNQHSRSKKHEFLSKKFSFKHYFFSEAENESSNQIKNEIIAKISQIIVIRNKTALIEEKNNLIKEKLEEESSEAAGKILALSKFYGCNNQENSWNRERLTLGFPNDVLWNEFKPLIIEKREKYWKFYSEMHQQNLPWRIRKKNFIAKNFYDCFEFYSSLSKDFIEVFSQIIITNYLTQDGNLHISDGNLKLMMGLPEQKEFEEVEAILKQKTNEKFLTYKKNFEKIYEFEKNYELKNKFTSNFKFYSEFDLFDQEHFCISIIRDFAIESINSNEKKLEIPLTDGDLKIMAGAPIEEEFISIKKTLNFQLSQREKKFFSYPDFPRVQLSKSFSFFSEFGDDLIIEFSRLIVIQFLKAKVLSNQNFSLELSLKDGDIKIMSGHSNENEMKSLKIAIQNEVDKKTSYFLKNSQNQTNLKKNNKKLRINYQHSEFDDFELKFFVKEIASLKFSKRKNFTRGDIKLLLGHAPNEEVEKTFRLILSQMEEFQNVIKPIENPKRLAPINPKTNVNKEDKAFHIAIVSFSNEHLKLKKSIQKHRYIIKESISIKVKIHFLLLSDKKNIQSLIEKDIYNYNKIRIFIFVLKVKEAQKYADFFPFETKFFMRETTDFVFCIDSKDSFEEIKQEFQWIQEIEKLIHSGNFYCLTDRINSQHFQEKLTNLIHSNIEQNYEGFSIKLMALSNIQIGKLFLSRGFKLFFITLIYPPNFPYDELDQRFYEKSINFAHGLRIKNVTKKLFLKNMLDFKNLSLDEELTINECLKIMSEKHKGDQTDLFLFVCNDQSLLFWERFFEKLKEDQLFWRKNEIASVLFSMKENTNIKDSEKNEVNEILKFEGKKFDSYVTSKSSLDKFIHNNIKERVEKYENFQIYLSNEFQEFNDNRKFESLKAYEIFLQHLDKKLYDEEFDRELAHELFYNQFMQKLLIQKEDILVFYANALKKIENFIKKIKKKTALFRQKKEIQNIKIIILEVLNLNEFYFEIGKDNACANVIKNYEINKISIEIKYGDQIFESTAVLMPNFSLDLKPLEASFAFDKVNHNKGFTIKLYDPNNEYFGSYSLKIQDWETRTKGKFDLNYVRKKIQTDRTMVQVNEINNVIPFLKLFFSYDKSTAPLEEDIESLNYELDRWIKAKIELNFFRVSPELNNRLNLINKRFEEMKFAKERISIRKTLSYEENNNIENLQKNLKKKRTEYMALKVILEEKNEKIKLIPIEIKQQEKKNLNRKEKEFKKKIEFIKVKEENKKKNQEINEIIIKKVENNIKELMKEIENDEHNKILKFLLDDHKTIKKSLISKQKKSSLKNLRKLLLGLFGEKEKIEIKNIVIKLDLLKEKQMIAKEKKTLEKIQSQIALNEKLIKEKKNILEKRSLLESFDSELSILENNLQNYEEKKRNMISEYKKLVNLSDKQKKEFNEKNLKDTEDMNKLSTQIEQDAKNLNELSVDIEKIEEKLEELLKNSQENKKTDEMISFFNSLKNEIEVKKLKEYLQQLMKSLSRFYLTSSVAESQIFERSKAKEVSFLESIAPLIPYGRPVLNLIAGILNFRDKTIKMNQFQSFSNITPNSSILDEIVQKSAFELIKIKKAVILQMSDNIQKGLLEQAQAKVKSWFFSKNQKIFKGLDTGAKIMANIDASTIIAHTYLKVLMYTNDNEGDIFNKKNIEKIFIQAACLVDPQKYAKILSIQDKWANFEFNFNVQEYFKKDKDYLKIFIDKDEKKKKEEKGKCVPNFFNCFKNKKKVHNLTSETEKSPTAI